MTATQISCDLTTVAPPTTNNDEKWRSATAMAVSNCSVNKTLVYLEKNTIKVGRKGAGRVLTLQPLQPGGKELFFTKIRVQMVLSNTVALKFLYGLSDSSMNIDNLIAYFVYDSLKQIGVEDTFFESIRTSLNNDFKLGSVVIPDVRSASANKLPKELRNASSACTTLVNKAVLSSYSEQVYDLLTNKLFKVLYERRGEIKNFKSLTENLQRLLLTYTSMPESKNPQDFTQIAAPEFKDSEDSKDVSRKRK